MSADDAPAAAALDARAYGASAWPESVFRDEIEADCIGLFYLLADADNMLLGYFGCWHVVDQLYLATIAVDPPLQGRGLGELLLRAVIASARRLDCIEITLEVRVGNEAAIALYDKYGFAVTGRRRNLYQHPREDGLHMTLEAPFAISPALPARAARAYPDGLNLRWRDRAGEEAERWSAPAI